MGDRFPVARQQGLSGGHSPFLYLREGIPPEAVDRAVASCTFTGPDGQAIELWWRRSSTFGRPSLTWEGAKYHGVIALDFVDDRLHWISCPAETGEVYVRSAAPFFSEAWTIGAGVGLVGGLALAGLGLRSLRRR